MSKFITAESDNAVGRLHDLLCGVVDIAGPKAVYATVRAGGFDVSEVEPGPQAIRIERIHIGAKGEPSILSVEEKAGAKPAIYVVDGNTASFDQTLTDAAVERYSEK